MSGDAARPSGRLMGVAVLVVVIAVTAGSLYAASTSAKAYYPKKWDARVAPIAAAVAKLRGLNFFHPVEIRYLEPNAFEKQLGADGNVSAETRAKVTAEEGVFRSLGFIGGKVDLLHALDTSETSSTLAYYDPKEQNIIVRGTTLDVAHRVTIAHELTHVLQDQHFDITKLQKQAAQSKSGDPSALKALIEGDAVRIQGDYLEQLSASDKKQYDRQDAAVGKRVKQETASVPEIVDVLSGAPYEFGPATVRVLVASGGNRAIDAALTGPTPSSGVFTAAGDVTAAVAVDAPLPPADGVAVGDPEPFGPFEMFLTLSMRLDPLRALEAADVVGGGTAITFQSRGVTCYRVSVDPSFPHSRPFLLKAVQAWARGRVHTAVDTAGDLVGFTACDPGRAVENPSKARFDNAMSLLGVRIGLTVATAKNGRISGDLARCFARVFVSEPGAAPLVLAIGNASPTADQERRLEELSRTSALLCRDDPDSGLA